MPIAASLLIFTKQEKIIIKDTVLRTNSVKILAIGNSFAIDGMYQLWKLLKAGGMEEVTLGILYIGSFIIRAILMYLPLSACSK